MILFFGGTGLLGRELQKILPGKYLSSKDCDVRNGDDVKDTIEKWNPELVVNLAAYTDVAGAEKNKEECFKVNAIGALNVAALSPRSVYISTDYAKDPVNFYSETKFTGEAVTTFFPKARIIRTSFKPSPFPYESACTDMWTNADYVDVIAPMIAEAILDFENLPLITNIGTERKSVYELAKRRRPDVKPISRHDIKSVYLPIDTSVPDSELWRKKIGKEN